jgi:hypothetical protein
MSRVLSLCKVDCRIDAWRAPAPFLGTLPITVDALVGINPSEIRSHLLPAEDIERREPDIAIKLRRMRGPLVSRVQLSLLRHELFLTGWRQG